MKIQCQSCQAKYTIADEKVLGKVVKIRCKKCSATIVINGNETRPVEDVYLLQKYFGRDGREEADDLLRRRSGDADAPRMLGAFNEATPDWLSFFMFTYFTDRDGKMQLESLAQSGFLITAKKGIQQICQYLPLSR
ncbi:zinc-ribbon domain-containing protein [Salmonella enterica]|uniref:Zinc finger/thioredoxin putative domain-containing protein n=1 Tax=Salmonella enterica subsp. enterica serovar Dessau TaxID=2564349 RepID=A0A8E5IND2_SALET|nr:zinc-ribbon domain-containing protein [Salmonella enterica]QUS47076.1 hypothetical protein F1331_25810 [Salmonella enterica subsp. enterica serovar Dessau]